MEKEYTQEIHEKCKALHAKLLEIILEEKDSRIQHAVFIQMIRNLVQGSQNPANIGMYLIAQINSFIDEVAHD